MDLKPIFGSAPQTNFTPTKVGMNDQDPSVTAVPFEVVTLGVTPGPNPATKDYVCKDTVKPNADGSLVFDPVSDPHNFGPVNILANLQIGLNTFMKYCDQDKIPKEWFKTGPFAGPTQLPIWSEDRKDEPNAFFNPMPFPDHGKLVMPGVHFGVFKDSIDNKEIFASASGEVVRHEGGAGHAFLNRVRPNYMHSAGPEVAAFHESFGDVTAMLESLMNPQVAEALAQQTGGDLSKPNFIADCGEQFGKGINHYIQGHGGPANYTGGDYVRTSQNNLKWADPKTLPDRPDPKKPDQLSSEAHDFSRVWTGAVYEILQKTVNNHMAAGMDAKTAIATSGDDLLKVYGKLISNTAPEGDFTFADMAKSMLAADTLVGGKCQDTIRQVMADRQILPATKGFVEDFVNSIPRGSFKADFSFTGAEDHFKDSPNLASLGGFSFETALSGTPTRGFVAEDHSDAKAKLADDLARLERQGKILFTTPDQKPETISPFDPITKEPYTAMVTWQGGQAKLTRVPIFG